MSRGRRSLYVRASDVQIRDARTGQPLGRMKPYSPSELNKIRNTANHQVARSMADAKHDTPNKAVAAYLKLAATDN